MYYTHEFMGHTYEVVNGSRRDRLFKRARVARTMGLGNSAIDLHLAAIMAPGCAIAHRAGVRHG